MYNPATKHYLDEKFEDNRAFMLGLMGRNKGIERVQSRSADITVPEVSICKKWNATLSSLSGPLGECPFYGNNRPKARPIRRLAIVKACVTPALTRKQTCYGRAFRAVRYERQSSINLLASHFHPATEGPSPPLRRRH